MNLISRKFFKRGWMPSADAVKCPKDAVLRMDNLVLDDKGILSLRKGIGIIYSELGAETIPSWAYWKMDESTGTRSDDSGNNRSLGEQIPSVGGSIYAEPGETGNALLLANPNLGAETYQVSMYIEQCPTLTDPLLIEFWFKYNWLTAPPDQASLFTINFSDFVSQETILLGISKDTTNFPTYDHPIFWFYDNSNSYPGNVVDYNFISGTEYRVSIQNDSTSGFIVKVDGNVIYSSARLLFNQWAVEQSSIVLSCTDHNAESTFKTLIDEFEIWSPDLP